MGLYIASYLKLVWKYFDIFSSLEKKIEERTKELKGALENIKSLKGLLPICAKCKKIRDDEGYWNQIEAYIIRHSDASFSHSICPECAEKLYGEEKWFKKVE